MLVYFAHVLAIALPKAMPWLMVAASGGHGDDHGDDHGGPGHLPSLVFYIEHYLQTGWLEQWVNVIYAFVTAVILVVLAQVAYRKREMMPGPFQNAVEMVVEGLYNFFHSILGKDAMRYTPFLGTLFVYIPFPRAPPPRPGVGSPLSLALLVFFYAQWTGIRRLGVVGYLDHLAGQPRDAITWVMVVLMFPLHIIGELAKPMSLALRLFGNITGEDTLIAVFVGMGIAITPFIAEFVGIPLQTPFYFLGLLLSTVQALVFALLSTIYILLMLPHEEHEH